MNFEMSPLSSISLDVDRIHWHSVRVSAENSRLIHIIPEAIQIVASFENAIVEEASPVILSI